MYTFNDVQIAKQTMSLRSAYGAVAMVITVWKGRTLLLTWNQLHRSIMFDPVPYYLNEALSQEDREILTRLVEEYYELNKLTFK